jgi:hypothetical protein
MNSTRERWEHAVAHELAEIALEAGKPGFTLPYILDQLEARVRERRCEWYRLWAHEATTVATKAQIARSAQTAQRGKGRKRV